MLNSLPETIRNKIIPIGECWIWTGYGNGHGYGRLKWNGRAQLAHRVVRARSGRSTHRHRRRPRHHCSAEG